jgi:acetyl-CoA synthetase
MTGYLGDDDRNNRVTAAGYYRTGDLASRDANGYITYIGRTDDVFKASDYKISPFELESVLIEHPAVAEAAVVPAPDPTRLAVPKAYVSVAAGWAADLAHRRCDLRSCASPSGSVSTHPAHRVHGTAEDDLGQDALADGSAGHGRR